MLSTYAKFFLVLAALVGVTIGSRVTPRLKSAFKQHWKPEHSPWT